MARKNQKALYGDLDWKRARQPKRGAGLKIEEYRSPSRKDFARLIHCPAFRRLQGKTQLYPSHESDFFRNRLTHSLEVGQIAKSIALKINHQVPYFQKHPIDLDIVELAGLAHDIGHPPFGHNGEAALDEIMKDEGGYEGNAQTLRILARLEKKETLHFPPDITVPSATTSKDNRLGLNLCYRSLASVLKYDNEIPRSALARLANGTDRKNS